MVPSTPGVVITPLPPGGVHVYPAGQTTAPPVVPPPTIPLTTPREIGPKYPTAGEMLAEACHAATAALVWVPKYPVAPAGIENPLEINQF